MCLPIFIANISRVAQRPPLPSIRHGGLLILLLDGLCLLSGEVLAVALVINVLSVLEVYVAQGHVVKVFEVHAREGEVGDHQLDVSQLEPELAQGVGEGGEWDGSVVWVFERVQFFLEGWPGFQQQLVHL